VRERPTLPAPGDLAGFPAARFPPRLHRVCRSGNGTWWFSSDGSGRFDLEPPEGTCYFATDLYAAIREASRLGPVTPRWVADREVRVAAPSERNPRLAATTRQEAGRFGMTTELVTLVPYDLPRSWAAAFRAHGFDGIRRPLEVGDLTAAGVRVVEPPHSAVLTIVRP
jgi:hypothetical protein